MHDKRVRAPINARSDSVFSSGLFEQSAQNRRCLVIYDGSCEPNEPKGGKRDQNLSSFNGDRRFALGG